MRRFDQSSHCARIETIDRCEIWSGREPYIVASIFTTGKCFRDDVEIESIEIFRRSDNKNGRRTNFAVRTGSTVQTAF